MAVLAPESGHEAAPKLETPFGMPSSPWRPCPWPAVFFYDIITPPSIRCH